MPYLHRVPPSAHALPTLSATLSGKRNTHISQVAHNALHLLHLRWLLSCLGDVPQEEYVLGQPLHWLGKVVLEFEPLTLLMGLTPLGGGGGQETTGHFKLSQTVVVVARQI